MPAVLAVGAVHHRLVAARAAHADQHHRETDDARDTHSFACLLGYGADVVCPRLALESIAELADNGRLGRDAASAGEAQEAYRHAVARRRAEDHVEDGHLDAGLATARRRSSRPSAWARDVIDASAGRHPVADRRRVAGGSWPATSWPATPRRFGEKPPSWRARASSSSRRAASTTSTNPDVVSALHHAVGLEGDLRAADAASADLRACDARAPADARHQGGPLGALPAVRRAGERPPAGGAARPARAVAAADRGATPVPLEEVEPATVDRAAVLHRRDVAGRAVAGGPRDARRGDEPLGGMSNCGEGGEDPARFATRGTTRDRNSKAKQVASGRFGVTPTYLAYADEIQIKMAQGSKPGEGGQLPGHKVSDLIARLRHTQPGVALISPPPHHDIYSIEDLAQLIYDLKQVNPFAARQREAGLAAPAWARSRPASSRAWPTRCRSPAPTAAPARRRCRASSTPGCPGSWAWPRRSRRWSPTACAAACGCRSTAASRPAATCSIAALLGADEYGFGTAALLAEGCIMVRACHRDTCPVGVATQRPELREKFRGTPGDGGRLPAVRRRGGAPRPRRAGSALHGRGRRSRRPAAPRALVDDARAARLDVTPLLRRAASDDREPRAAYQGSPADPVAPRRAGRPASSTTRSSRCGTARVLNLQVRHPQRRPHRRRAASAARIGLEFGDDAGAGSRLDRSASASPARPARASARSSPTGSSSCSPARRTTTSARAWRGGRIVIRPPGRRRRATRGPGRQHRAVRRDRRRAVRRRPRGRALRRPQLRRLGGRRGRGRPRLRVHDRRRRRGPRRDRLERRRRHDRRRVLRARRDLARSWPASTRSSSRPAAPTAPSWPGCGSRRPGTSS